MQKLKVLLADDERIIRDGMVQYIPWEQEHLELVATVKNGEEALEILKHQQVDILLTDIKMPIMDGMQLLERIDSLKIDLLIIIISAYSDFTYTQQAIRSHKVFDYILKPVDIDQLIELLHAASKYWRDSQQAENSSQMQMNREINMKESSFIQDEIDQNELIRLIEQDHYFKANDHFESMWHKRIAYRIDREYFFRFTWEILVKISWMLTKSGKVPLAIYQQHEAYKVLDGMKTTEQMKMHCQAVFKQIADYKCENRRLSPYVKACMAIIEQRYADSTLSLAALSNEIIISANYLSTQFKKEVGIGFSRYLNAYRIEQSKVLLQSIYYRTYEVSAKVGLEDVRYFSKLFKEIVGVTPSNYRRIYGVGIPEESI